MSGIWCRAHAQVSESSGAVKHNGGKAATCQELPVLPKQGRTYLWRLDVNGETSAVELKLCVEDLKEATGQTQSSQLLIGEEEMLRK